MSVGLKVGIIGAGNMGGSIYKCLQKNYPPSQLFISDPNSTKIKELGVKQNLSNQELAKKSDLIILAIKPQIFAEAIAPLRGLIKDKIILSIMAGITIARLIEITNSNKIIRCMPNLGTGVGQSLTAWYTNSKLRKEVKTEIIKILETFGKQILVAKEIQIDQITSLSGSGPAYFFLMTEILEEKALQFGFTKSEALLIAKQTILGASLTLQNSKQESAEAWRQRVTSKGGTTQAALDYMQKNNFSEIIFAAIDKAFKRSIELSK